jgi:energy-coupling factor transport system ATP-binding protein
LVGASGAGKSTIARLALGLLKPASGAVRLGGLLTSTAPLSQLARIGGLVLQNPLHQLLAETVVGEVSLGLGDLPPEERAHRVDAMLDRFGLLPYRLRHPLSLSEGERRRLALAAILVREPRVLVLDEPTLGQDEGQRASLVALLLQLSQQGVAILAISHDPELVNDACERALILRDGRLTADVSLDDDPRWLREQGLPLAEVPATVAGLADRGRAATARTVEQLLEALSP